MYDWWVLQLAKLSVSRKLMVGFGVLLALLLLVVISSNRTLTHQTALSEQLAEVASLMEQTQQAEQGRLAFEAGSDPRQAEQVRQTLAGMLQRLQALRDSELDPAALAHQTEAIEAYRKAFDDLAAADQQRSAARGVLVGTAQQALDSFARLEELMDASLAQQAGDPQALQRSRAVADLHQQLLMVRYQVRGYVFERSDKAEQAAFAAFDALRQAATTLRGQLPGEADAALEQAMGSLQGYRGGIEQFRAGVIRTRQAQQAMQSSTQDMARAGRTLTEAGRQLRESTASRDRASLWLIAALALAFGCVAGWAINRQIVRPLDEALAQAEAIAAGDLGKRPQNPLTLQRRDELGQLQRVMQRMGDSLRELVGRIGDGVSQLASSAEELSAVTEQTRAGVNSQKVETDQVATAMHRTQQSTAEIEGLIQRLQQGAGEAAERLENSRSLTASTVELARRAGAALDSITRTVSDIQNMNLQIATAAEQQSTVAEEINRSVLSVRDVAEQSAAASEQTAASSGELARLGTQLQAQVGRFRL
ncbi:HAMP domain-containing protein [Pseudomonas aeruginosa]|nr:HAMP domain-containing protein [Pseudomonas aeruginosa]